MKNFHFHQERFVHVNFRQVYVHCTNTCIQYIYVFVIYVYIVYTYYVFDQAAMQRCGMWHLAAAVSAATPQSAAASAATLQSKMAAS